MGRPSTTASEREAVRRAGGRPKPPSRAKERALRKKVERIARQDVRVQVWVRDNRRCRRCEHWVGIREAHIHEHPFRSRGGDPLNPQHALTLCPACHLIAIHGQGRRGILEDIVIVDEALGTDGPVNFVARDKG